MDPLDAEIRQVVFFDHAGLDPEQGRRGGVRARRIQGGQGDTGEGRGRHHAQGFRLLRFDEGQATADEVRAVIRKKMKIRDLFTKSQRAFYTANAPDGLKLSELSVLGPINVMKLPFEPDGLKLRDVQRKGRAAGCGTMELP